MSRVRNADEFLQLFRRAHDYYERLFGPRVAEVRRSYTNNPLGKPPSFVDDSLEAHSRAYFINAFLAALNWRLNKRPEDELPALIPEAPVTSSERGRTRFLDYLGLERETNNPLLVVETKRPNIQLPQLAKASEKPPSKNISEILSRGLAGEPLRGKWSEWLADLRDYVCSVHVQIKRVPRRVVLTNGD